MIKIEKDASFFFSYSSIVPIFNRKVRYHDGNIYR